MYRLILLFIIFSNLSAQIFENKGIFLDSVNINIVSSKNNYYPIDIIAKVSDINNLSINIPYKVDGKDILLPSYSQEVSINKKLLEQKNSNVKATLSWESQVLNNSGFLKAKITIKNNDDIKFIQLSLLKELVLLKFDYPSNNYSGKKSYLSINLVGSIKSRNFDSSKNKYIYFPIKSPKTNRIWLNNNLGSEYNNINSPYFSPFKRANGIKDYLGFGSLYEWKKNICPLGFRMPTKEEFIAEIGNHLKFKNNLLNLTYAGMKYMSNNNIFFAGKVGNYWLNSSNKKNHYDVLRIYNKKLFWDSAYKEYGFSVRCINEYYAK